MKKASEYRQHADECRALARGVPEGEQRDQLLEMAATWERLAAERSELARRHPELGVAGEVDEELRRSQPRAWCACCDLPPQAYGSYKTAGLLGLQLKH